MIWALCGGLDALEHPVQHGWGLTIRDTVCTGNPFCKNEKICIKSIKKTLKNRVKTLQKRVKNMQKTK